MTSSFHLLSFTTSLQQNDHHGLKTMIEMVGLPAHDHNYILVTHFADCDLLAYWHANEIDSIENNMTLEANRSDLPKWHKTIGVKVKYSSKLNCY